MATKSSSITLLAKLANIIRNPAFRKADANDSEPFGHSDLDQKKLRERIESKRRDDSVRKREFTHLRKMLANRRLTMTGFNVSSRFAVASSFQGSSGFSAADRRSNNRAATVKKIDAIEALMSEQWTRRKHPTADSTPPAVTVPDAVAKPQIPVVSQPKPLQTPKSAPEIGADMDMDMDFDLDFTGLSSGPAVLGIEQSPVSPEELGYPALQTAATRFAEGDVAAAQAVLEAVVQDETAAVEAVDQCALALVDLYRGQGDLVRFDAVAIAYAQRFGRSAPEWYSVPQLLGHATPQPTRRSAPRDGSLWACPPLLDAAAVARLAASQNGRDMRLVNWEQLQTVSQDALKPLTALFTQWSAHGAKMMFDGMGVLNAVLEAATPMSDRQVAPERWLLRLETLRLQGLHEEYETIALDYCVTYEVSPPSWISPASVCTGITPEARASSILPGMADAPDSVPSAVSGFGYVDKLVLQGELLGDAALGIEHVMARVRPGDPIVINCHNLIRVDFAAAGRLLNWLAQHEAENLLVQFVNVPRLVSVFFQEMGISEFAEVSVSHK